MSLCVSKHHFSSSQVSGHTRIKCPRTANSPMNDQVSQIRNQYARPFCCSALLLLIHRLKFLKTQTCSAPSHFHLTLSRLELPPVPALHHSSSDAWAELNNRVTASFLGILKKRGLFHLITLAEVDLCYQCWKISSQMVLYLACMQWTIQGEFSLFNSLSLTRI